MDTKTKGLRCGVERSLLKKRSKESSIQRLLLQATSGNGRIIATHELAAAISQNYYTVRRWINGTRRPPLSILLVIAEILAFRGDERLLVYIACEYIPSLRLADAVAL